MDYNAPLMGGHSLVTSLRYTDTTRQMTPFEVRSKHCPYGTVGSRMRLFLSEDGYIEALECKNSKQIKIRHHAYVIKGNLAYSRKKNKSRRHKQ